MDELFRSKMHEALDAIQPSRTLRALNAIPAENRDSRSMPRPRLEWALGLIAALLALAIVAGLMYSRGQHVITVGPGVHAFPPRPMSGMVTSTAGWVIGPGGHVFRTTDGGAHWKDVTPAGSNSNGVAPYFFDADRAWISQDTGPTSIVILRTSDGGASWRRSAPITVPGVENIGWINLFFRDSTHGWLVGGSVDATPTRNPQFEFLYGTTDGGAQWTRLADTKGRAPACPWATLAFSSATTGWITTFCQHSGGKPELFVSHDAGARWDAQPLPASLTDSDFLPPPIFFDPMHGILGARFVTSDGGHTWAKLGLPAEVVLGGNFIDAKHGWVVAGSVDLLGSNDPNLVDVPLPLYRTADGGMTWTPVATDLTIVTSHGRIQDLYFINEQDGFAVAVTTAPYTIGSRTLYATTDGGATWRMAGAIPT